MTNILIVAFEDQQWGASRLPKGLGAAGFHVAALCPSGNPLARTRYLEGFFPLTDVEAPRRIEAALVTALRAWRPRMVIPGDERAVACLQALARRTDRGGPLSLTDAERALIVASLAPVDRFEALLIERHTLDLAREIGVPTPSRITVDREDVAVRAADRLGYPVHVKAFLNSSGSETSVCHDRSAVQAAVAAARATAGGQPLEPSRVAPRCDPPPANIAIEVRKAILGASAMYCAVAVSGRVVAGFAGIARPGPTTAGHGSVVWVGAHPAMAAASAEMTAALGATGFIGFDFTLEARTGEAFLLACHPRPIDICHLGPLIGVNLCAALAVALDGDPGPALAPSSDRTVSLFPQAWLRDADTMNGHETVTDVPWDDPALLGAMVAAAA